jgi:hypothetical protein
MSRNKTQSKDGEEDKEEKERDEGQKHVMTGEGFLPVCHFSLKDVNKVQWVK